MNALKIPDTSNSFWIDSTPQSTYPALTQDLSVDVAIIGAGLVGITAAKLLKQAGKTVALLEADCVAAGASGRTTAKITSLHSLVYADLIDDLGEDCARLYGQSNQKAIEKIADLIAQEQIDCDFERKEAYTFATSESNLDKIQAEVEAAQSLGLPASFVKETALPFEIAGAVKLENQAQFHPRKYALHLAKSINGDGSYVFENTRVTDVDEDKPCQVKTQNGATVTAANVIVATNLPFLDRGLFFAKSYARRSYLIGAKVDPSLDIKGMFISIDDPYRSMRTTPTDDGGKLLLVGGESHKVGEVSETEKLYERLAEYARSRFGIKKVDYRWSGQDMMSFDQLPYIGKLTPASDRTYVATGFSLWGMSKSVMAAMLLSDLILGRDNPWAELYDSTRATPFVTQESIKQNLDVGARWVGDRFKGVFDSPDDIKPGEGKLVTVDGEKVAAYRDESGTLHQVSAVCTHLACIVAWNSAEKSWDCPCHGARFSCEGKVLHGPAIADLEKVEVESD